MTFMPLPDQLMLPAAGGIAVLLTGLLAWWRGSRSPARDALLGVCVPAGVALITWTAAASPGWPAAAYGIAAAMLPAGLFHLALTFPADRIQRHRGEVLPLLYLPCLALALVSQLVTADRPAGDLLRTISAAATAGGAAAVVLALAVGAVCAPTLLLRRRSVLGLLGALGAALPALAQVGRGGPAGGGLVLLAAAPTAVLFPLAVAAALAAPGLIRMDDLLRRVVSGALLALAVAATYLATWLALGTL